MESEIIQSAIEKALERIERRRKLEQTVVTDEQVARLIGRIAEQGYEPRPEIVPILRDWIAGYGILLSGPAGVGKTFLMRCLGVHLDFAPDITNYGLSNLDVFHETRDGEEICIDDLGAENMVSEWGIKGEVMKLVIGRRAEQNIRTHITTNLTSAEISVRYGDRILSRIIGMCKVHRMTGRSKRQAVPIVGGGK